MTESLKYGAEKQQLMHQLIVAVRLVCCVDSPQHKQAHVFKFDSWHSYESRDVNQL
jgi:hypothetical protein